MKINEISNSLEETLEETNLIDFTSSLAEMTLDELMDDGIAKKIPVIGTVIGLRKAIIGIKELLLLKKIIYFINEIKNIPLNQRHQMIAKINNSGKYQTRVGERLLYIIDKCSDHETSQIIARLFSAFLSEIISYDEFIRSSHIINQVFYEDLRWFVNGGWETDRKNNKDQYDYPPNDKYLRIDEVGSIATSGLVELISPEITVEDQWDRKADNKYIVEGSELTVCISDIGEKIREILKDFFKNMKNT